MAARPAIIAIDDETANGDARVTVTLDWADQEWHGSAIGGVDERFRLAGEATLHAVEQLTGGTIDLELLAVATTEVHGIRVALAQVRFGEGDVLVGSALEGATEPGLAAVRAVMDAVNRRLGRTL